MFDRSSAAVNEAKDNTVDCDSVILTETCSMQDYKFNQLRSYSAIYMRWTIGYLGRAEQLAFLKKASEALAQDGGRNTRAKGPASFIFVQDNLKDKYSGRGQRTEKRQSIETEEYYQKLFEEAKLTVF